MIEEKLSPRFNETDALGHINNNVYTIWFDLVRVPLLKLFDKNIDAKNMPFILAHNSVDFLNEVFYGKDVIIKTALLQVGNSSMHFAHAIYQDKKLCTVAKAVMIHYCHKTKKSLVIGEEIKEELSRHLFDGNWDKTLN